MTLRAGGDRPSRRPVSTGRLAGRAALLALLAVAVLSSMADRAEAAPDPIPPFTGPGPAIPLPAPDLPGPKAGQPGKGPQKPGKATSRGKQGKQGKRGRGSASRGLALTASCSPFGHTQTYVAWGPAAAYGETVTVVYEADRCSTPDGSALDLTVQGNAKIFHGETDLLLDTRPFLVTGTWRKPTNSEAWPPPWWGCRVPYARYTWEIPGVYTFQVSARDGLWSLDVSSQGVGPEAVSWTHDGCA